MSDTQNNSLIKAFLVVILGTIAFGLLFNLLKGGDSMMDMMGNMNNMSGMNSMNNMNNMGMNMGNMDMNQMGYMNNMGMAMGNNYTLNGILGGVLALLVKFLMVVLVAAVIIGVIVWIKNNFFKDSNFQFKQTFNNDPVIKTVSVVTLGILAIVLIAGLFGSFLGNGMGSNFSMNAGMGYGMSSGIAGLISLLVQILSFVLVISLILAAFAYLKKQYDNGVFSTKTSGQQANTSNAQTSLILPESSVVTTTTTDVKPANQNDTNKKCDNK